MRKFLVVLGVIVVFVSASFGAVKFKGEFIGIGDFKYMQSNYVYNNVRMEPYFGLDNVEFIVNLGAKLELVADIFGFANVIVQPTTKFKHVTADSLMINYFHKASKLKIIPFYRFRAVRFDDPENVIGWFNSWVISSSVFGVGNVIGSKVDANGFYVDSSSTARAGGIPYLLRPVEFMDGTIVSMPGMGEDTTNLALVGRDLGGFYAEQKARDYVWQVFLGAYFIDGSEGALNMAGGGHLQLLDLIGIWDIFYFSFGLDGMFYSFGNSYRLIDYYDLLNVYRIGTMPNKGFRTSETVNAYLLASSEFASLYVKGGLIGQGVIQIAGTTNVYRENITANGIRFSGGFFSDFIEGLKAQVSGEYVTLNVFTNTNVNGFYTSTRLAVNGKVLGEYELIFGGISKVVVEGAYVKENSFNDITRFVEYRGVDLAAQGRVSLSSSIGVKGGLGLEELFDFLGFSVVGSYQVISFKPEEFANVKRPYEANIIEARGSIDISLAVVGFDGIGINLGGRYFSWNDNLRNSRLLLNVFDTTRDISVTYISPLGYIYYETEGMVIRVGYGYPVFGSVYDIDFGLVFDALNNYVYRGTDGKFEGFYADYVLQNLPRVYVDVKISF